MTNLFTEAEASTIDAAIRQNRIWAGRLAVKVLRGVPGTGARLHACNEAWIDLERERHQLTGIDPYPYRLT